MINAENKKCAEINAFLLFFNSMKLTDSKSFTRFLYL